MYFNLFLMPFLAPPSSLPRAGRGLPKTLGWRVFLEGAAPPCHKKQQFPVFQGCRWSSAGARGVFWDLGFEHPQDSGWKPTLRENPFPCLIFLLKKNQTNIFWFFGAPRCDLQAQSGCFGWSFWGSVGPGMGHPKKPRWLCFAEGMRLKNNPEREIRNGNMG